MEHKVFRQGLSLGSLNGIGKKIAAFSLAEMLIVLLIMSFIAIGVPAIHFKKTALKTKRSLHGRFECYYNGNQLMQYTVNEEGAQTGPTAVGECSFTPPRNAVFLMVHAVGGGGGASNYTGSISSSSGSSTTTNTSINDIPDWAKEAQGAGRLTGMNSPYTATVTGKRATVRYGQSGKSGTSMSMFFPNLRNVTVTMRPGKGGAVGASGTKTEVYFSGTKVMDLAGGAAGSGSGVMSFWLDGPRSMCRIKDLDGRRFKESEFAFNVELDTGTRMTKMVDSLAGSGGAGSYGNITSSIGRANYVVNGTNVTTGVQLAVCDNITNAQRCDDGTSKQVCPAQAGRDGAVVILW